MGAVGVAACAECGQVEWVSRRGPLDPAEAMASLFGGFRLIGPVPALWPPAPWVLAYSPPSKTARANLAAVPERVWLAAAPRLWMSHGDGVLLLATDDRLLFENLARSG